MFYWLDRYWYRYHLSLSSHYINIGVKFSAHDPNLIKSPASENYFDSNRAFTVILNEIEKYATPEQRKFVSVHVLLA
jgi:hypothetical protein